MISQAIGTAIASLYTDADVLTPSLERPIVPLGDLINGYNLTCTEISGLTRFEALRVLTERGALVDIAEADGSDTPLAGFLYVSPHYGSIFVEQADPVVRRRFTVAHELGHYLLHFRPLLVGAEPNDGSILEIVESFPNADNEVDIDSLPAGQIVLPSFTTPGSSLPSIEQMEREANQFAAELLMPNMIVEHLSTYYSQQFRGEDLIWRLATEMLVSRAAMRWRLRNLGLLPSLSLRWN